MRGKECVDADAVGTLVVSTPPDSGVARAVPLRWRKHNVTEKKPKQPWHVGHGTGKKKKKNVSMGDSPLHRGEQREATAQTEEKAFACNTLQAPTVKHPPILRGTLSTETRRPVNALSYLSSGPKFISPVLEF